MTGVASRSRLVEETASYPLSRGSTLLHRPTSASDIVALVLTFPMGCREETAESAGRTTLALHMLSRGTQRKSDYELAVALESIGASFSADVQKDRATLTVQTITSQWEKTLGLVREILTEPGFPEVEFEIEKDILIKEIREELDSPFAAAHRLFQSTLFAGKPYGHPGSGTEESVASLGLDVVREAYFSRIGGLPMSIALVGDIEIERAVGPISEILEALPASSGFSLTPPSQAPGPSAQAEVCETRSTEAECMIYGWIAPGFRDSGYPVWKVLDSITGGSMDSRLFSEIREKRGLVYQIGSSFPALEWQSYFAISLVSTRQNHDQILEQLAQQVVRLKETLPDPEELARAKTYLKGIWIMGQEKNADQAHQLARYHSQGLGIDFIDRYPRLLEEVTAEAVQSLARQYLHNPLLAIVGPGAAP
jgi:zinc protease